MATGLPVTFYGRKPVGEMPEYYAMADAMLVKIEKKPVLSLTLLGKAQSYMAAGKAIIGAIDGETHKIVTEAGCGFIGSAENSKQLFECVRKYIALSDEEGQGFGDNGRKYYESQFSHERFTYALESWFMGIRNKK